jgi:hypothetical protein
MAVRYLRNQELQIAKPVFRGSLPWDKIQISSRLGLDDIVYTWGRTINAGPCGYNGLDLSDDGDATLIHELTHVWQYEHRKYSGSYILDAAATHIFRGQKGYKFEPGKPWNSYNAEQQASIVEKWYTSGKSENPQDPLFPYVRNIIRAKHFDPRNSWSESDPASFTAPDARSGF